MEDFFPPIISNSPVLRASMYTGIYDEAPSIFPVGMILLLVVLNFTRAQIHFLHNIHPTPPPHQHWFFKKMRKKKGREAGGGGGRGSDTAPGKWHLCRQPWSREHTKTTHFPRHMIKKCHFTALSAENFGENEEQNAVMQNRDNMLWVLGANKRTATSLKWSQKNPSYNQFLLWTRSSVGTQPETFPFKTQFSKSSFGPVWSWKG